jgi:hypothetical protein
VIERKEPTADERRAADDAPLGAREAAGERRRKANA